MFCYVSGIKGRKITIWKTNISTFLMVPGTNCTNCSSSLANRGKVDEFCLASQKAKEKVSLRNNNY